MESDSSSTGRHSFSFPKALVFLLIAFQRDLFEMLNNSPLHFTKKSVRCKGKLRRKRKISVIYSWLCVVPSQHFLRGGYEEGRGKRTRSRRLEFATMLKKKHKCILKMSRDGVFPIVLWQKEESQVFSAPSKVHSWNFCLAVNFLINASDLFWRGQTGWRIFWQRSYTSYQRRRKKKNLKSVDNGRKCWGGSCNFFNRCIFFLWAAKRDEAINKNLNYKKTSSLANETNNFSTIIHGFFCRQLFLLYCNWRSKRALFASFSASWQLQF